MYTIYDPIVILRSMVINPARYFQVSWSCWFTRFFGTLTLNDTRSPLKNFYEEFSWLWAHPILWLSSQCPYNGNTLHSGETHSNAHLGSNQRSASLVSEGETRKFCQVLFKLHFPLIRFVRIYATLLNLAKHLFLPSYLARFYVFCLLSAETESGLIHFISIREPSSFRSFETRDIYWRRGGAFPWFPLWTKLVETLVLE